LTPERRPSAAPIIVRPRSQHRSPPSTREATRTLI